MSQSNNERSELAELLNASNDVWKNGYDEKARSLCVETFLAFHSFEIGHTSNKDHFLLLQFNGDAELYKAMVDPQTYHHILEWVDYDEKQMNVFKTNNTDTIALIQILKEGEIIYEKAITFNSFDLFSEVLLPWNITNADGICKIIYLSCLQKQTFFDQGLKTLFYIHKEQLEPLIVDERKTKILEKISKSVLSEINDMKEDETIVLRFLNGDRDIMSAFSGTIKYVYYEKVKIDTLDKEYQEKLTGLHKPILVLVYKPESEEVLYYGINSFPSNEQ